MTINEIFRLSNLKKKTVSSKKAEMYKQDAKTFIYWLLKDSEMGTEYQLETLKKILEVDDWEFDNKDKPEIKDEN